MRKIHHLLIVALPVILAIVLANLITPFIYTRVSSDFGRTKIILEALRSENPAETILFGNSVLMSGINAKQLARSNEQNPVYNFGSNGQTLKESFLFYPLTPPETKKVLQFIQLTDLESDQNILTEQVLRNFIMYGYDYQDDLTKLLAPQELAYFDKNKVAVNYDARSIVPNVINRSVRMMLRSDLDLSLAENDLYFPNVYSRRVDADAYRIGIERLNPRDPKGNFSFNKNTLEHLLRAKAYFKGKNIRYIVVLNPINPDLFNITKSYKQDALTALRGTGLDFINCVDVLDREEFVDNLHISKEGAGKLTAHLQKELYAF